MFQETGFVKWGSPLLLGIAFGALVFLNAKTVQAGESFNGHRFLSLCLVVASDHQSEQKFKECENFVKEVRLVLGYHSIHGQRACIPDSVLDVQLLIAGIARIESVPEQQNREAHEILSEVYAERWPCNG